MADELKPLIEDYVLSLQGRDDPPGSLLTATRDTEQLLLQKYRSQVIRKYPALANSNNNDDDDLGDDNDDSLSSSTTSSSTGFPSGGPSTSAPAVNNLDDDQDDYVGGEKDGGGEDQDDSDDKQHDNVVAHALVRSQVDFGGNLNKLVGGGKQSNGGGVEFDQVKLYI